MDRMKGEKTLTRRLMERFVVCMMAMIVLAIPVLYFITTRYYAEDLTDLVLNYGIKNPDLDLEQDTIVGLFIQFLSFVAILVIAVLVVMRYVPQRLWQPFNDTLAKVKQFRVEKGNVPQLEHTGTKEFDELNATLTTIMADSVRSYQVQKEFTENASHELQTPLAIVQSKLDNLLQDPQLTQRQAEELVQIYQEIRHTSRLSRNLLLLSKIENNQYSAMTRVNVADKIDETLPHLASIAGDIKIKTDFGDKTFTVSCNETLLESLINNLVVNAVRHNRKGGSISISVRDGRLSVDNLSDEPALDPQRVFSRFYRTKQQKGNGLGLAIVKSICDYHHWHVGYEYSGGMHKFVVDFGITTKG